MGARVGAVGVAYVSSCIVGSQEKKAGEKKEEEEVKEEEVNEEEGKRDQWRLIGFRLPWWSSCLGFCSQSQAMLELHTR